jgi:hypothetical protein
MACRDVSGHTELFKKMDLFPLSHSTEIIVPKFGLLAAPNRHTALQGGLYIRKIFVGGGGPSLLPPSKLLPSIRLLLGYQTDGRRLVLLLVFAEDWTGYRMDN